MIPKIIHYCWFGGKRKPEKVQKNIKTWRFHMPDYELKEWNEDNFKIGSACDFVKEAYAAKKWAFVSDYVRLMALYEYGGIYLDTDVEVFKSFDDLLDHHMALCFESKDYIATSTILCEKGNPFIRRFMHWYDRRSFIRKDGSLKLNMTNVRILTKLLKKDGLACNGKEQKVGDILILPQKYFSPNNFLNVFGKYHSVNYCYHHADASWETDHRFNKVNGRLKRYVVGILRNNIGTDAFSRMRG